MQFVAASKLKRAQDATLASRPYSEKLDEVLADLAAVLGGEDHPLLAARREGGKRLIVLITTDRGLAGPLNTNTIRFVAREITEHPGDLDVVTVGRKGRDAMRRARRAARGPLRGLRRPARVRRRPARSPGSSPTTSWPARTPRGHRLQPVRLHPHPAARARHGCCRSSRPRTPTGIPGNQFIFEPERRRPCCEQLLPRYVATRLFQAVLESKASEESSRMVAMKNATENAEELIEDLTLSYNKVRQANITREMIEIASGANAR